MMKLYIYVKIQKKYNKLRLDTNFLHWAYMVCLKLYNPNCWKCNKADCIVSRVCSTELSKHSSQASVNRQNIQCMCLSGFMFTLPLSLATFVVFPCHYNI